MTGSTRLDLRYAWRSLRHQPSFFVTSVAVLAIGIAAVTVTFSTLHGVVLQPLPFSDPDRLVWLWATTDTGRDNSASAMDYYDYRDRCRSFSSLAAQLVWRPGRVLTGDDEPERVTTTKISGNLFATLGVEPLLGRSFVAAEEVAEGPQVVVVSHSLWQRRLGGGHDALGLSLTVEGEPYEVVGVMPAGFDYPSGVDLWFPMQRGGNEETSRGNSNFFIVGRLADGVSLEQAQAEVSLVAAAAAARLLSSLLFATSAADPLTYLGVSALLLAVALIACLYPAQSAVRTNPSVVLRSM